MITTLLHAANTTTSSHDHSQHDQSPASQRVRGGRGGGHDNDLVSHGQHDHISSHPRDQHDQSPASQRVRGGGGGYDNDLVSRGQHDQIHSRPHPVEFRHSLL